MDKQKLLELNERAKERYNIYFYSLKPSYKKLFEKHKFYPTNDFEANSFLRSIYDIDKNKTITVKLKQKVKKQGKNISTVIADKNNYLDLFCPDIWEQLKINQKMQAIVFAYDDLVQKDITVINERPQLVFVCSSANYDASNYLSGNQNIVNVNMDTFVMDNFNSPIYLLTTLKHELTHCKQSVLVKQLKDRISSNNKKGISNKNLNEYELSLLTEYGQYFSNCNEVAKSQNLPFEYSHLIQHNKKDLELLFFWEENKDKYTFNLFLTIFYMLDASEQGAYNKGANYTTSLHNYYSANFDEYDKDFDALYPNVEVYAIIKQLNTRLNCNFKLEDIEEFKKINTILANSISKDKYGLNCFSQIYLDDKNFFESANWVLMKKVLQIYKDKCIVKKIPQSTVDKFKQHTIQELDKDCEWIKN